MSTKEKQRLMKTKRPRIERPQPTQDIPVPSFRQIPEQPQSQPQHTEPPTPERPPSPEHTQTTPHPEPPPQQPTQAESSHRQTEIEKDPSLNDHLPKNPNLGETSRRPPTFWPENTDDPLPFRAYNSFTFGADGQFEDHTDQALVFATAVHQGRALASFSRLLKRQIKGEGADQKLKDLKAKHKALKKKKKKISNEKASLQSTNATLQQQIDTLFESSQERNQLQQKVAELSKDLEEKNNQNQLLQQQTEEFSAEVKRQDAALKSAFEDSEILRKSNEEMKEQLKSGTPELCQKILQNYQSSQELADRIVEQFAEGFEAAVKKAVQAGVNPDVFYSDDDAPEE